MKLLVSGATGLLGSRLVAALGALGHEVCRLTRQPQRPGDVGWQPADGKLDGGALDGVDAVVHLAGENIAGGRWSAARKRRIMDSRVGGTSLLAEAVRDSASATVLISASAIGFYGDRGDEEVDESSPPGDGFLAEVCQAWEAAAKTAAITGTRVATLRLGAVLASGGGMLSKMLPVFRLGLGGVVGSGGQWLSWIAVDDAVGAICHAVERSDLVGPVNVTAPEPVTNRQLTKTLGRLLHRPTVATLPALLARIVFGELADELLLASTRVRATRLEASDYAFRWPRLEPALGHILAS